MRHRLDSLIHSLVLVRLGQELGTSSDLAQAIAHTIDFAVQVFSRFSL